MSRPTTKPLVIYHGNCADGFTSAWLANMHFREQAMEDGADQGPEVWYIDAHPGVYGKPPPNVKGREVYILDFSYDAETMTQMALQADTIVNIDHHETAIKRLAGYSWGNVKKVFDISKSGALLTARYFWPDIEPLEMVKLVSDRDLWQFKDHRSMPFSMGLFSYPYGLREWNDACANIEQLVIEGAAIQRKHLKDIRELLATCETVGLVGGKVVPVCNLPYTMASDACAIMLDEHPDAPFVGCYYVRADGKRVWSLRSQDHRDNVATVAEGYGGGGHRNASGFREELVAKL